MKKLVGLLLILVSVSCCAENTVIWHSDGSSSTIQENGSGGGVIWNSDGSSSSWQGQ